MIGKIVLAYRYLVYGPTQWGGEGIGYVLSTIFTRRYEFSSYTFALPTHTHTHTRTHKRPPPFVPNSRRHDDTFRPDKTTRRPRLPREPPGPRVIIIIMVARTAHTDARRGNRLVPRGTSAGGAARWKRNYKRRLPFGNGVTRMYLVYCVT